MENNQFEQWAILELFGHRKLGGLVRDETVGGATFIRIDVPGNEGEAVVTQYYNPSAVYSITPATKETAVQFAKAHRPQPVTKFELILPAQTDHSFDEDDGDFE